MKNHKPNWWILVVRINFLSINNLCRLSSKFNSTVRVLACDRKVLTLVARITSKRVVNGKINLHARIIFTQVVHFQQVNLRTLDKTFVGLFKILSHDVFFFFKALALLCYSFNFVISLNALTTPCKLFFENIDQSWNALKCSLRKWIKNTLRVEKKVE